MSDTDNKQPKTRDPFMLPEAYQTTPQPPLDLHRDERGKLKAFGWYQFDAWARNNFGLYRHIAQRILLDGGSEKLVLRVLVCELTRENEALHRQMNELRMRSPHYIPMTQDPGKPPTTPA